MTIINKLNLIMHFIPSSQGLSESTSRVMLLDSEVSGKELGWDVILLDEGSLGSSGFCTLIVERGIYCISDSVE